MTNSTVSSNVGDPGSGIRAAAQTLPTTLNYSTVADNAGTGIFSDHANTKLQSTIVANNDSASQCDGASVVSFGYNLASDGSCNLTDPTDLPSTDPQLSPLHRDGGATDIHSVESTSPVIDKIPNGVADCGTETLQDQRWAVRPMNGDGIGASECDIGAYEAAWPFTDLGTLGGDYSIARAINESGQIVGNSDIMPGSIEHHAFLWEDGNMIDLGTLGGTNSLAMGINDLGQVVGWSEIVPGTYDTRAFLWENGVMTELATIGDSPSLAYDINNDGLIVGQSDGQAALWEDGAVNLLGSFGGNFGYATGINDSGQVTGYASNYDRKNRAFLWESGVLTDLGTLGGDTSNAHDINNLGHIIGSSALGDLIGSHGFVWANDTMTDLGTLGSTLSRVYGINDLGQIVGSAVARYRSHATLWENGVLIDLCTWDVENSWAYDINEKGQIVGMSSYFPSEDRKAHAVLWSLTSDSDGDGIADDSDNAPEVFNPDQSDLDGDGIGDVADVCPNDATDTCDVDGSAATYVEADEGGTLTTPDETASIYLPPGAMSDSCSVSMTDSGDSGFVLSSNQGGLLGISSVDLQPSQTFDQPVILTFSWEDADNDGIVDDLDVPEQSLVVTKDGEILTDECADEPLDGTLPDCDQAANTFQIEVLSWSEFALALASPPEVNTITAPADPVNIADQAVNVTGTFSDADDDDSHTATWHWGDGTSETGIVEQSTNTVSGSHTYTIPGVYTVGLDVTDSYPRTGHLDYQYVVVYDPDGGFVTGGGWIDSQAEACPVLCDGAAGKANFGFVSKYGKKDDVPTGQARYQLQEGGFNLQSDGYEWLVVAAPWVFVQGTTTIDGSSHTFLISAADEKYSDAFAEDRIRLQVWTSGGEIVYDNEMGSGTYDHPLTELGNGSIALHQVSAAAAGQQGPSVIIGEPPSALLAYLSHNSDDQEQMVDSSLFLPLTLGDGDVGSANQQIEHTGFLPLIER